jgi:hypothetical protein
MMVNEKEFSPQTPKRISAFKQFFIPDFKKWQNEEKHFLLRKFLFNGFIQNKTREEEN